MMSIGLFAEANAKAKCSDLVKSAEVKYIQLPKKQKIAAAALPIITKVILAPIVVGVYSCMWGIIRFRASYCILGSKCLAIAFIAFHICKRTFPSLGQASALKSIKQLQYINLKDEESSIKVLQSLEREIRDIQGDPIHNQAITCFAAIYGSLAIDYLTAISCKNGPMREKFKPSFFEASNKYESRIREVFKEKIVGLALKAKSHLENANLDGLNFVLKDGVAVMNLLKSKESIESFFTKLQYDKEKAGPEKALAELVGSRILSIFQSAS